MKTRLMKTSTSSSRRRDVRQRCMLAGLLVVASVLVVASFWWSPRASRSQSAGNLVFTTGDLLPAEIPAVVEGAKLLVAAFIGVLVTLVQRQTRRDQPLARSMEQAHVLLCVSGALIMIIIGDSVARAFGIAGAASVIRFRTPVDDPRDITVLFLLMALGMAAGLGLITVAGVGALFLCACLLMLRHTTGEAPRLMKVALVGDGQSFPAAHVSKVFAEHQISVAPLEMTHGDHTIVRYRAVLDRDASVEDVSAHLLNGGTSGIKSVSWETLKKSL